MTVSSNNAITPGDAADILKRGGLVAIPTETVYGLAANALDPVAVARIFAAKERPFFDPLIVHLADISWWPRVASTFPPKARQLAERFWPGPLTLVLPKADSIPDIVTSGLPDVAVRVPDHPLAREVLRLSNLPLAAPSANPFGRLSPTTAEHVRRQLGDRVAMILDGGPCRVGVESTIIRFDGEQAVCLRPGGAPLEEIERIIGPVIRPQPKDSDEHHPAAPGMLASHYAPRTKLIIVDSLPDLPPAPRTGVLSFRPIENADRFTLVEALSGKASERSGQQASLTGTARTVSSEEPRQSPVSCEVPLTRSSATLPDARSSAAIPLDRDQAQRTPGDSQDEAALVEAASNFFQALHRLDIAQLNVILATPFPNHSLGRALNDRLQRAAHE